MSGPRSTVPVRTLHHGAPRAKSIAEDGDSDWWDDISPAYEWMMGEVNLPR